MSQKEIMVIKRKTLFPQGPFDGFISAEKANNLGLYSILLKNLIPIDKKLAENSPKYKQPISYVIIRDANSGNVFFYIRSKKIENYEEGRLLGLRSGCVGGHVEIFDVGEHDDNPILRSAIRELCEETGIVTTGEELKFVGAINDNSDSVGKVHLGLVFSVTVDINLVKVSSPEIAEGRFVSPYFIKEKCKLPNEVENWTKILAKNDVF